MKLISFIIITIIYCCFAENLFSQTSDTIVIKTIDITDDRSTLFSKGKHFTAIDSAGIALSPHQSLAEMLSANSSVFIKSYSSGGSATISARGTEARHNAVLWNGFNINSSSLGLTDLSIVPTFIAEDITLILGGSGPVNGNSTLGSTVVLENHEPTFENNSKVGINFEAGSFGTYHGSATYNFGNKFVESKTIAFFSQSENDFEYINFTHREMPEVKQQHAAFKNFGLIQNLEFKIKTNHFLTVGIWYQFTNREIPPLMTSSESHAEQRDSLLRIFTGYKIIFKNSVLKLKGAFFNEFQFYDDEKQHLAQKYLVNSYLSEAEWRINVNEKFIWNLGAAYTHSEASFEEYNDSQTRTTISAFTGIIYHPISYWTFNLNIRKEFTNNQNGPFSPSLGIEGLVVKRVLHVFGNVGRHYNLPSMNDLYWVPGGNKNLLPEDAWTQEAGLIFFRKHKLLPEITLTGFNSIVDNWIKWQPSMGGIYSPNNLRQVHSKGIETTIHYSKKVQEVSLNIRINYAWCKSSVSKTHAPSETVTVDKQLIYVPENVVNGSIFISTHGFTIYYNHTITGLRYTTSDNSKWLDDFQLANLTLEKNFQTSKFNVQLYGKIINLFDTEYQVIAYRPMPGRWFSAGIKFNLDLSQTH